MREWRNILKEKLVDANIFEEGQNNLLKRLRKRKMNEYDKSVCWQGWLCKGRWDVTCTYVRADALCLQ